MKKIILAIIALALAGCSTLQIHGVESTPSPPLTHPYTVVGHVHLRIHKVTIFDADPTDDDAYNALVAEAKAAGGDTIIDPRYDKSSFWGYIDAEGVVVKYMK